MSINQWQEFLQSQGANWDDTGISYFDSPVANADERLTYLIDTSYLGALQISGAKAVEFLQGQVTADMQALSPTRSVAGAQCNLKGRMLFSFRAVMLDHTDEPTVLLLMPRALLDEAREALAKYAVFAKVSIQPSDTWASLGVWGPDSQTLLSQQGFSTAPQPGDVVERDNAYLITVAEQRYLLLANADYLQAVWQGLTTQSAAAGGWQWQLANIRDGWGEVLPGAQAEFLPQMLNFDLTGGVSFNKGCYLGQEVVARMQYRGKLKRHMRRAELRFEQLPRPGEPVYPEAGDQPVGHFVCAAPLGSDHCEALVVVTDSAFSEEAVYADPEKSTNLRFLSLPYAITKEGESE